MRVTQQVFVSLVVLVLLSLSFYLTVDGSEALQAVDMSKYRRRSTNTTAPQANNNAAALPVAAPSPDEGVVVAHSTDPLGTDGDVDCDVEKEGIPAYIQWSLHGYNVSKRASKVKFIDAFLFNNELEMLDLRLHALYDVADHFVLVEAVTSFTNRPKPLHYAENSAHFSAFADKIVHVVVPPAYEPGVAAVNPWVNEARAREAVGRYGLAQIEPSEDDFVFVSDVDAFPDPNLVWFLKHYQGYPDVVVPTFRRTTHSYWHTSGVYDTGVITTVKVAQSPTASRDSYQRWTVGNAVNPAGWHCTMCLPPEDVALKIRSFSHSELVTELNLNLDRIRKMRIAGAWFDDVDGAPNHTWTNLRAIVQQTKPPLVPCYGYMNQDKYPYLFFQDIFAHSELG